MAMYDGVSMPAFERSAVAEALKDKHGGWVVVVRCQCENDTRGITCVHVVLRVTGTTCYRYSRYKYQRFLEFGHYNVHF